MTVAGWAAFPALVLCPGAWLTFVLLPLGGFWARLLIGAALSPLVVLVQFYALRAVGIPFGGVAVLILFGNLVVLRWMLPQAVKARPSAAAAGLWLLGVLPSLAIIAAWFANPANRLFRAHAWVHTDIVNSLVAGALWPEEPLVAGLRLSYPWAGHVFQAVASWWLRSPAALSYAWTNTAFLLCTFGLVSVIVRQLGGSKLAALTSPIWLSFGVNTVGYVYRFLFASPWGGTDFADYQWLIGDPRFSPWLRKYFAFEQIVFGIALFAALALLVTATSGGARSGGPAPPAETSHEPRVRYWVLAAICLTGVGVLYPILFPAAAALIGVFVLVETLWPRHNLGGEWLAGALSVAFAATVTFALLRRVTVDGAAASGLGFSELFHLKTKLVGLPIVFLPLLAAAAASVRTLARTRPREAGVLLFGALASMALYWLFTIPHWNNEYKFAFTAAVCLAPLASLLVDRLPRRPILALSVSLLVFTSLFGPAVHALARELSKEKLRTEVTWTGSTLELAASDPHRTVTGLIRTATPPSTVVVSHRADVDLATLTRRTLFVPYGAETLMVGLNLTADDLLKGVRGYDPDLIDGRRRILRQLYEPATAQERAFALAQLRALGRPLAIIVDGPDPEALRALLVAEGGESLGPGLPEGVLMDEGL